jgi:glutamine amidotransferase
MRIRIIDYGLGNVGSFLNIYKSLNIDAKLAAIPRDLEGGTHIILPGVGSFDWAMQSLVTSGLLEHLNYLVLEKKYPVLGVCVGMQIMARFSEEGSSNGLSWIDGSVKKFLADPSQDTKLRLPHMGWNTIKSTDHPLLYGLNMKEFYFLHSYYFRAENANDSIATTEYNTVFTSAVHKDNIMGVQFHPEKSHDSGIRLLNNFALI